MTTEEMIAVMQAFVDGKEIEARLKRGGHWIAANHPCWDWKVYEYRVNSVPREFWINEYQSGPGQPHSTREEADSHSSGRIRCIHVREVTDQ